jgi:hypothetical protein
MITSVLVIVNAWFLPPRCLAELAILVLLAAHCDLIQKHVSVVNQERLVFLEGFQIKPHLQYARAFYLNPGCWSLICEIRRHPRVDLLIWVWVRKSEGTPVPELQRGGDEAEAEEVRCPGWRRRSWRAIWGGPPPISTLNEASL